jgi:hypothetical protein
MVVIVESGEFVLNVVESPAFVVDPQEGQTIHYMFADYAEDDFEKPIVYSESDHPVLDETGQPCMDLCTVLPPSESPPTEYLPSDSPPSGSETRAVLLREGFRVEGLAQNVCLWCLFGEQVGSTGSLLVFPYVKSGQEFSWLREHPEVHGSVSPDSGTFVQGDPESSDAAPVRMSWMFNPGGRCNRHGGS